MEEVNALKVRNHLGEILDRLAQRGEPILITKAGKIRAVLVAPQQFERWFSYWRAEETRKRFMDSIEGLRRKRKGTVNSLIALRKLRGYAG